MKAYFIAASVCKFRSDIFCTYRAEDRQLFTVHWGKIGEDLWDIDHKVMACNESLASKVEEALRMGESEDNDNPGLYLSILEQFTAQDCITFDHEREWVNEII